MIDEQTLPVAYPDSFKLEASSDIFEKLYQKDVGGVYSIAISGIYEKLIDLGYRPEPGMPEVWSGDYLHSYIGETYSLKTRLRDHLFGENGDVGFRRSIGIVLGLSGDQLSGFLFQNSAIAYRYVPLMGDVESHLIQTTACPLNLRGKGSSRFAKRLRQAKRVANHLLT